MKQATDLLDANAEITRALSLILEPGQVTELRILDAVTQADRRPHIESGYFDDFTKLAEAVATIKTAKGFYFVPNPVNPALLARAANRIRAAGREPTTADHDIAARRWLLIDVDAKRPAGISASNAEHDAALELAFQIRAELSADYWPEPIIGDSGNGAHLLYRVDLPRDDSDLIKRCLAALAARFDTGEMTVDQAVYNPARIWKLYGTFAAKGDNTQERPHRLAQIIEAPPVLSIVDITRLESLATTAPATNGRHATNGAPRGQSLDIDAWIQRHSLDVNEPEPYQGGRKWVFRVCPWNSDHTNLSAVLIQYPSGALSASCRHAGCQGKDWHALRDLMEPGRRDVGHQHRGHGDDNHHRHNADEHLDDLNAELFAASVEPEAPPIDLAVRSEPKPAADRDKFTIERLTSREFDSGDYQQAYLVDEVLAELQPLVIAAALKTMKTTIGVALAIALALGRAFLGKFWVREAVNVLLISGESGLSTLQSAGRRIAESYGYALGDVGRLFWSTNLPRLGSFEHLEAVREAILRDEIAVLIVDPLYYMLPGEDAGNLMIVGGYLRSLSAICEELGVTLVVIHHVKKTGIDDKHAPPELSQISWAGTAEWARQWLLLSRRENYLPGSGEHRLWMTTGGSAGHSGLHALDIHEGVGDVRTWSVDVLSADEVRNAAEDAQENAKEAKRQVQLERDKRAILAAVAKLPEHQGTKTEIRDRAARNSQAFNAAFAELVNAAELVPCEITKPNNRTFAGFRLANDHE